jgi:hypothetical protein
VTHTDRVIAGRKAFEYDDENARFAVVFDATRTCILIVSPYSVSVPRPVDLAKKFFDS